MIEQRNDAGERKKIRKHSRRIVTKIQTNRITFYSIFFRVQKKNVYATLFHSTKRTDNFINSGVRDSPPR